MGSNLIVVKQLPIIEDQLRQVKASVDERVAQALALACTEETYHWSLPATIHRGK